LGPAAAAVLTAFVVAVVVLAMVDIGGGVSRPLVTPAPHVAATHAPAGQS
jgi:hypothetical protein